MKVTKRFRVNYFWVTFCRLVFQAVTTTDTIFSEREIRAREITGWPEIPGLAFAKAESPVTVPTRADFRANLVALFPVKTRWTAVLAKFAFNPGRALACPINVITAPAVLAFWADAVTILSIFALK